MFRPADGRPFVPRTTARQAAVQIVISLDALPGLYSPLKGEESYEIVVL